MFFVSGRYYFYCLILEKLKVRYVNSKKFFLQVQTNSKCFLQIDFARAYIIKLSHLGHYVNIPKSIATPKIILASISFITFKYFLFVLKKRGTYSLSLSLSGLLYPFLAIHLAKLPLISYIPSTKSVVCLLHSSIKEVVEHMSLDISETVETFLYPICQG